MMGTVLSYRFQATEEDFTESSSMTTLLKSYLRSLQESLFTQRGLQRLKDTHELVTEQLFSYFILILLLFERLTKVPHSPIHSIQANLNFSRINLTIPPPFSERGEGLLSALS